MARWGFVRHGESVANAGRWLAGQIDVDLTPLGVEQARGVRVEPDAWARIVSSDLVRAARTAELAIPSRAIPAFAAVRERTIGDWDGRSIADIRGAGEWELLLEWDGLPPGGGESNRMLARRVLTWLAAQPDEDTLVFAHGGVIRSIVGLVDGMATHEIPLLKIANCAVHERDVTATQWAALLAAL